MLVAGIDAGSRAIKAALFDTEREELLAAGTVDQGIRQEALARQLFESLLDENGLKQADIAATTATGYGRGLIRFADATVTEITCHARGVHHLMPGTRSIIEIGGQDSKVIRLDGNGSVHDFAMNDRCAAGTGRFLEMLATRLEVELEELGRLLADGAEPAAISSTCVVFAETEVVGLLASGAPRAAILAGVQRAIAQRVGALAGRNLPSPVCFTGGVATVPGMAESLSAALGHEVTVAPAPQMTGALGAALSAARQLKSV